MANQLANSSLLIPLLVGFIPSIIWLLFWLNVDKEHPEPFGLLLTCFVLGGAGVLVATFVQQSLKGLITDPHNQVIAWAAVEEIVKFGVFYFVAYKSAFDDKPIEPPIYLIAVALGFAALENIFYVFQPNLVGNVTAIVLTGGLRFFGSTLLHTIASCFIGISISILPKSIRGFAIIVGIAGAIFLHATFNFFILNNDTASMLQIYGFLWIAAIISHIILEKLRRIPMQQAEILKTT
ncbi:MAG TPA: PrsW family glutamic-type intramembrane protease [Candidatus Paceibacterota bacterium]|jgi:RsiW-degrading membrane proteinase PrsW (M82 family)|nr:PrsW family glutamic-type intramembrane protease [Candidatus Paceibacterota bacterium]